jgi:preprotein translocase subunit YajC
MNAFRLARSVAVAAALVAAVPAAAQVAVGAQVVDTAGNPVGTVVALKGANLVLKTDRHEVQLPVTSFTPDKGKLLFAMSRAQLNASTDAALAAAEATIVVGAEVRGSGGAVAGTIDAIDTQAITLKLASGEKIRLPKDAIAGTPNGPVLGVSVDELKAMAANAAASAGTTVAADAAVAADTAVEAEAGAEVAVEAEASATN